VYTNAVDKGLVLDHFLGDLVLKPALRSPSSRVRVPPAIYFADDRSEVRMSGGRHSGA
jgi:hypothetical protein